MESILLLLLSSLSLTQVLWQHTIASGYNRAEIHYLERFGYLPEGGENAMMTESSLRQAVMELQRIGGIPMTGVVDKQTKELFRRSRCGVKDEGIVRTSRLKRNRKSRHAQTHKWHRLDVRYRVENAARSMREKGLIRRVFYDAVSLWNEVSGLEIRESQDPDAEIQMSFQTGQHGDYYPFDGRDRILAHAFYPANGTGGDIHFDDDESWALRSNAQSHEISLLAVAVHEIGHSLGLKHSEHSDSIMYPYYSDGDKVNLHHTDHSSVQGLYGPPRNPLPTQQPMPPTKSPIAPTQPPTAAGPVRPRPPPREPDTKPVKPSTVDPCYTPIDAITSVRQEFFVFRKNWFWRFDANGSLNASPRKVSEFWRDLPTPVDAAFELNDHVFFFVGKKCYEYWGRSLVTVRNLTDFGLPPDLEHVRLAYSWNYGNEAKYYIWSDEEYWKIDIRDMRKEVDYPRPISLNWKGIPSDVSAATTWGKDLLFFGDGELYKFGSYKMSVARGYPKPFSHTVKHCMPRAEALVGSCARLRVLHLLAYLSLLLPAYYLPA